MKTIELDIISGDALRNEFMHCADVFESGKHLAEHCAIIVEGELDLTKLCMVIKDALEANKQNVIFVGINNIDGIRHNPMAYIKPNVQTLSNGEKWGMFRDKLLSLGYKPETDEFMHVISVNI